jgi:hypothetical protein
MLNDGTQAYNQDLDGGDAKLAGCHMIFRGFDAYVRVVYDDKLLRVYLDTSNNGWDECFVVRNVSPNSFPPRVDVPHHVNRLDHPSSIMFCVSGQNSVWILLWVVVSNRRSDGQP